MTRYGFHASNEQIPPSAQLRHVRAQEAGFGRAMCSDHFVPFGPKQGHFLDVFGERVLPELAG